MRHDEIDAPAPPSLEVGFPCRDTAAMRRFYCEGLGFAPFGTVLLPTAHIEGYRLGAHLIKATLFADEAQRPQPSPPSLQSAYVSIRVSDIHAVVTRCGSLGYHPLTQLSKAVTAEDREVNFIFLADPMGNRIELVDGDPWLHQR